MPYGNPRFRDTADSCSDLLEGSRFATNFRRWLAALGEHEVVVLFHEEASNQPAWVRTCRVCARILYLNSMVQIRH